MNPMKPTVYLVSVYNTAGIQTRLYTLVADSLSAAAEKIGERTPMAYMDGESPKWRDQETGEQVDIHLGVVPIDTITGRRMVQERERVLRMEDGVRRERELRIAQLIDELGVDAVIQATERLLEERKKGGPCGA